MNKPLSLVLISCLFILLILVLVPFLTQEFGPALGYLIVFCIYWFGFCLPMGLVYQGRGGMRQTLRLFLGRSTWVPVAIGLQILIVAIANWRFLPDTNIAPDIVYAAVAAGLVNGFLEEFFWRGAYFIQGRGKPWYQALGVALFTLWHIPLVLAVGITYHGGPFALLVGSLFLGGLWALITYRTGAIGWPIVGHVAANIIGFIVLFSSNFA